MCLYEDEDQTTFVLKNDNYIEIVNSLTYEKYLSLDF